MLDCLLVARDSNIVRVLSASLTQAGIEPKVCATTDDAIARLHKVKFDAIMIDCVEFEESGFEALRTVRRTPPNSKAVVFAIVEEETSVQQRAQTGANFVLERPLQPEMLMRSIRAARNVMIGDRRRYFRQRVDMRVSLLRGNRETRVDATNLSGGGMAVRGDRPLELGWSGQIEFVVPEIKLAIQAKGEIVWTDAEMRAGIRFDHIPVRMREPLEKWLAQSGDPDDLAAAKKRRC